MKAQVEFRPLPAGDVKATYADVSRVRADMGFAPGTPLRDGVHEFVRWYREYYKIKKNH